MSEYVELARQAIMAVEPVLDAGATVGAGVLSCAVWDWIKGAFPGGASAEAVREVEQHPDLDPKWMILQAYLEELLSQREDLRTELEELLQGASPQTNQITDIRGNRNTVIQQSGTGNKANTP